MPPKLITSCPACGRRVDLTPSEKGDGVLPEHDNWRQTARCDASGKRYMLRNAAPTMPTMSQFVAAYLRQKAIGEQS